MTSANGLPTINTYSGHTFDYVNTTPEMIDPKDIAHALSHLCRFAGQAHQYYSVAQHSVLVSILAQAKDTPLVSILSQAKDTPKSMVAQWGLLHDAAEAYCVDIPRPLKRLLPEYKTIETRVQRVIAERFGLTWPMPETVEAADRLALAIEGISFMDGRDDEYGVDQLPNRQRDYWRRTPLRSEPPHVAKCSFMLRAEECFGNAFDWGLPHG